MWLRIAGIIESDDIKAITDEIDRAITYSNNASSLVESVRGKYKGKKNTKVTITQTLLLECSSV